MSLEQYRDQTIIHGTLRNVDLIPAFLDVLQDVAPAHYAQIMVIPFSMPPAYAMEDHNSDWWESETAVEFCMELIDTLSEHAPEGCYFGSHPGDGSEFGFWTDI